MDETRERLKKSFQVVFPELPEDAIPTASPWTTWPGWTRSRTSIPICRGACRRPKPFDPPVQKASMYIEAGDSGAVNVQGVKYARRSLRLLRNPAAASGCMSA